GDEGSASGGAALLAVPVGKHGAFTTDAVDVGRAIAHDSQIVGADIEPADVIAHDEENVGLAPACRGHGRRRRGLLGLRLRFRCQCCGCYEGRCSEQKVATVDTLVLVITHATLSICDYR